MRWMIALVLCVFLWACTPSPKDVRCSNQGDCQRVDPAYGYCLQNRCVQCLDDPGCGEGGVCKDGLCAHKCFDGRDCGTGQVCSEGVCQDRT